MPKLELNFVTHCDVIDQIRNNMHRIPADIDLVVGIPRSGMIPAYAIGLYKNLQICSLTDFAENNFGGHGLTRDLKDRAKTPHSARKILLVDDSYNNGTSMKKALETIRESGYQGEIVTCVIIARDKCLQPAVDLSFMTLAHPRIFEWNMFHHNIIQRSCLDFDGVLCVDPTDSDNDDGPAYIDFLQNAKPLHIPSVKIGHIVSARLEKYRPYCEAWLEKHGIEYGQLHLIDLPDGETRRRLQAHIPHKVEVYRKTKSDLFIESDEKQARGIAAITGRPVISLETMSCFNGAGVYPGNIGKYTEQKARLFKKNIQAVYKPRAKYMAKKTLKFVGGLSI